MAWNAEQITKADSGIRRIITSLDISYRNILRDETICSRYDAETLRNNVNILEEIHERISKIRPENVFQTGHQKKEAATYTDIVLPDKEAVQAYVLARKGLEIILQSMPAVQREGGAEDIAELKNAYDYALAQFKGVKPVPLKKIMN